MSFCVIEKLQIIRNRLKYVGAYERLTENEKTDIKNAIYDGLEDIERKALEYERMQKG